MFLKLVSIKFFADNDGVINIKKPALHVFFMVSQEMLEIVVLILS